MFSFPRTLPTTSGKAAWIGPYSRSSQSGTLANNDTKTDSTNNKKNKSLFSSATNHNEKGGGGAGLPSLSSTAPTRTSAKRVWWRPYTNFTASALFFLLSPTVNPRIDPGCGIENPTNPLHKICIRVCSFSLYLSAHFSVNSRLKAFCRRTVYPCGLLYYKPLGTRCPCGLLALAGCWTQLGVVLDNLPCVFQCFQALDNVTLGYQSP